MPNAEIGPDGNAKIPQTHSCAEKIANRSWVVDDNATRLVTHDAFKNGAGTAQATNRYGCISVNVVKPVCVNHSVNQLKQSGNCLCSGRNTVTRYQISKELTVEGSKTIPDFRVVKVAYQRKQ
jgi:hypothetical protein